MHNEDVRFSWNDFPGCVQNTFKDIYNDEIFADVTLATVDNQQIKAHKVILASFSPLFKAILVNFANQHALIFLNGIKYNELKMIMSYMYTGECEIVSKDIETFIKVGTDLQIKGIVEGVINAPDNGANEKNPVDSLSSFDSISEEHNIRNVDEATIMCDQCSYQCLQENMLTTHKQIEHNNVSVEAEPDVLLNTVDKTNLLNYKENNDTQDVQDHVDDALETRNEEYTCNQCEFQSHSESSLKNHLKDNHDNSVYSCDRCQYTAPLNVNIKQHIKPTENSCNYTCNICQYKFGSKMSLTNHMRRVHSGFIYTCNQCPYESNIKDSTKRHQQLQHKDAIDNGTVKIQIGQRRTDEVNDLINKASMGNKYSNTEIKNNVSENQIQNSFSENTIPDQVNRDYRIKDKSTSQEEKKYDTFQFTNTTSLLHRDVSKPDIVYSCNKCKFTSKLRLKLMQHIQSQHDPCSLVCDVCDTKYSNKAEVYACTQRHKKKRTSYYCDQCGYEAHDIYRLDLHTKAMHMRNEYNCDQCNYLSNTERSLKRHKIEKHHIKNLQFV